MSNVSLLEEDYNRLSIDELLLNIRDIETSELGPKENYLLGRKDLPSMWPVFISVIGFILLYCFFEWIATSDMQISGTGIIQVEEIYKKCVPLGYALL